MKKIMITMCVACLCSVNVSNVEASMMQDAKFDELDESDEFEEELYISPIEKDEATAWLEAHPQIATYYTELNNNFSRLANKEAPNWNYQKLISRCTQYRTLPAVDERPDAKYLASFTITEGFDGAQTRLTVDRSSLTQLNEKLSNMAKDRLVLCAPDLNFKRAKINRNDSRVLRFGIVGNHTSEIVDELLKTLDVGGGKKVYSQSAISLEKEVFLLGKEAYYGVPVDDRELKQITRLTLSLFSDYGLVSENTYWIWGDVDASL